jgi:hypothetical protein
MPTDLPLLRQSERAAFKRCQWAWYQEYVRRIRPIVEKSDAADFGTIGHVCLAEYYTGPGNQRGPHPAETWMKLAGEMKTNVRTFGDDEQTAKWEDFYELGIELLDAYVEKYQGDPHWDVIVDGAERRFSVLIPDVSSPRLQSSKGRRIYKPIVKLVGTMDLCVRDLNQEHKHKPVVKMVDHKFLGRILETEYLTLDEQPSTYICVATHVFQDQGLIGNDEAVMGMEYNFVKRAKLDTRLRDERGVARNNPQKRHYIEAFWRWYKDHPGATPPKGLFADNAAGTRFSVGDMAQHAVAIGLPPVYGDESADQSSDNFKRVFVPRTPAERQRQIVRISEEARVMDMIRTGQLPVLKTPTKNCLYCKFFDMCELDEGSQLDDYFIETTMKAFDPYADHREGADNSKKVKDGRTPEGQRTS